MIMSTQDGHLRSQANFSALLNPRHLQLDNLPSYNNWIPYILGLNDFPKSLEKTAVNVTREFGEDKWGDLKKQLNDKRNPTVYDADRLTLGEIKPVAYYQSGLYVANSDSVQQAYYNIIQSEARPLVKDAGHLVELGAGYGSQLLKLAAVPELNHAGFTAGEYTKAGVECIELLAATQSLNVNTMVCDLNKLDLSLCQIPPGAVFMTCWTMAYVKGFPRSAIEEILRKKPSVVLHVEPIFEHWSSDSLLQMMWKKYVQLNDYNQILITALKEYEAEGLIKVVEERPNVFGTNPLAPVSIVKWIPCK